MAKHCSPYSFRQAPFFILSHHLQSHKTMATTTTLLSLPLELLYQITGDLSYGTHLALSFTCRELYARLDPNQKAISQERRRLYNMEDLLEIELWPEFASSHPKPLKNRKPDKDDFFACYLCLRIRSGWNFASKKMDGVYGKRCDSGMYASQARHCINCGIRTKQYSRGSQFHVGGWKGCHGFVCRFCGGFEREQYRFEAFENKHRCEYCRQESDYKK